MHNVVVELVTVMYKDVAIVIYDGKIIKVFQFQSHQYYIWYGKHQSLHLEKKYFKTIIYRKEM